MTGRTRPGRQWSLGARLTAWYAASAFLIVLIASAIVYGALSHDLYQQDAGDLATELRVVQLDLRLADPSVVRREVVTEVPIGDPGLFVRILTPDGRTLMETPGMSSVLPASTFAHIPVTDDPTITKLLHVAPDRTFLLSNFEAAPPSLLRIQAGNDHSSEEHLLAQYRKLLSWILLASLGVCAVAGYAIARLGIRPLEAISRTAARIGSENLAERIGPAPLPAELADLAEAFDAMLDRLEAAFERQSQFSADLAHELRTPLNILRGEAEVALSRARGPEDYREVIASSLEEYERLSRIIDSLLFIARAENPSAGIERASHDLQAELEGIRDYFEAAAAERGIGLELSVPRAIRVPVDRTLLQRAVGNLVSNAIRHTPEGGRITLSATLDGDAAVIGIADTGEGIAPEHLPHVFERFYRVEASRTASEGGSGLGLSLVRSIAALHGGTVHAESRVGEGTTFELRLPIA